MDTRRYLTFVWILLVVDWVLGACQAHGLIPLWTFLVVNFAFGGVYVWFESHWTGTQYAVGNQAISELWPLLTCFPIVFLQAWLYYLVYGQWHRRHANVSSA